MPTLVADAPVTRSNLGSCFYAGDAILKIASFLMSATLFGPLAANASLPADMDLGPTVPQYARALGFCDRSDSAPHVRKYAACARDRRGGFRPLHIAYSDDRQTVPVCLHDVSIYPHKQNELPVDAKDLCLSAPAFRVIAQEGQTRPGRVAGDGNGRVLSRPLPYPPGSPEAAAEERRQAQRAEQNKRASQNGGNYNTSGSASAGDAMSYIRYFPSGSAGQECALESSKTTIQNVHDTKQIVVRIQQIDQVGVEPTRPPWEFDQRLGPNQSVYSCSYVPCEYVTTGCPLRRSWTIRGAHF